MRALLRPARPDDAEAIAAIYAPHVVAGVVSFETQAPDAAAMRARMAGSAGLYPWIVAVEVTGNESAGEHGSGAEAGRVIGYAYATGFSAREAYRWAVEVSVYLADAAQGRGIGRQLYVALLATLRTQGFTQAVARIALPNPASLALHARLGFRHAGVMREIGWKHGAWVDVEYRQCALASPAASPGEPRPFVDVGLIAG